MPGVPLDAFSTMKKGIKSMFRKKAKEDGPEPDQYHQYSAADSGYGATPPPIPPPPVAQHATAPQLPDTFESKHPPPPSKQEPVAATVEQDTLLLEQQKQSQQEERSLSTLHTADSHTPNVIVTPASADASQTAHEVNSKLAEEDERPTATTKEAEEQPLTPPATSKLDDQNTSDKDAERNTLMMSQPAEEGDGFRTGTESPPPPMQATSGPLEDNPILA